MLRLQFEIDRLRHNKKIATIAFVFLILSILVVFLGIYEYKTYLKEKEKFLEYEKLRVEQISNYQYYGALGFKLLSEKYLLDILFNVWSFRNKQTSNIDVSEVINIGHSSRGKARFIKNSIFIKGFCDIIYFLGSLFMLYLGATCISGINNVELYRQIKPISLSVNTRLLVSLFYFFALLVIAYLMVIAFGIKFSAGESKAYVYFSIYTLFSLIGFFVCGFMIDLLNRNSKKMDMKYVYVLLIWGLMVVGISMIYSIYMSYKSNNINSIEVLNIDKLRRLKKFEDESKKKFFELMKKKDADQYEIARELLKDYINRVFPENNKKEKDFINNLKRVIQLDEGGSLVFPTTYYHFLANELSSSGNYIYLQFLDCTLKIREDFVKYYIHKRYYAKDKKIENFVKNNENLFKAQPFIPPSYPKALAILLTWLAAITLISYLKLKQITTKKPTTQKPNWTLDTGTFYYMYIENPNERSRIFNSFPSNDHTSCLAKIDFNDFEPKTNIRTLLHYWGLIRKIPEKQLKRYLFILGFQDAWLNTCTKIDALFLKKLYLAAVLAEPTNLLVIHDFIKNEDQDFDEKFRELLQIKISEGKTIVYLSSIMPETIRKKAFFKKSDTNEPVKVENARILSFR